MFGEKSVDTVVREAEACRRASPGHHVRVIAYDNIAQSQGMSFVMYRAKKTHDFYAKQTPNPRWAGLQRAQRGSLGIRAFPRIKSPGAGTLKWRRRYFIEEAVHDG